MKRLAVSLFGLIALICFVNSCSKEDNEGIIGEWELIQTYTVDKSEDGIREWTSYPDSELPRPFLAFNEDETFCYVGYIDGPKFPAELRLEGTWNVSDGKLYLMILGPEDTISFEYDVKFEDRRLLLTNTLIIDVMDGQVESTKTYYYVRQDRRK